MRYITPTEWQEVSADQHYLNECLAITEQQNESDTAVVVTADGCLIATAEAWQHASLALLNLKVELQARQQFRTSLLGEVRDVRSFLHDAEAKRQQQQQQAGAARPFDRTRAQLALEDLISQALLLGASDIHLVFDPQRASLAFRVHGCMVGHVERSRETLAAAIAAALNTRSDDFHELFDEQRLSSASINVVVMQHGEPQRLRLRVQKSPTRNGFAVTMRLQLERQSIQRFTELGASAELIAKLSIALEQANGLLIIVGPTGQGKTTSLAALNLMIPPDHKIISLEDPIEIIQPHIEQKPVAVDHPELNFANMVKVALREDPDVISISEIRDAKTAQAAYTAALTGHLVTATLHAHDCFGALQRLNDLGLTNRVLAQQGVLCGVLAQRLVKQVCQHCQGQVPASGCSGCQNSGVGQRRLVTEFLEVTGELCNALRNDELDNYRMELQQRGWRTLTQQLQAEDLCQV
ncbi:putative type II secretion system protein HxcR [Pseudidiomarina piscicola]|uniref:Putative type II secretion system protein HxcR n=1 Tax=Pseudidiomarina piscicola TaxID=2614830 RepID=A0A6S6WJ35_9GAMM|nr:ATPase, T2SS/T4P/T4SS family [Pseudidiomarina piscicola]CAB0149546.1 putative type II secretion system protein HxcR [Pseudidiomarina piscicola]VZT38994.1 putative type II secretion system protein HxcR [Pseudomonas aeruginosa]